MSTNQKIVDSLLVALGRNHIRCTYEAVGDLIGVPAASVSQYLGDRRSEASWVVSKSSELPSGYSESEYHADLFANSYVIKTGEELKALIQDD